MFKDIMIERLFGFINDEQEKKYYDFEDTILLLFKIEDLYTFMQGYKFLNPYIGFGFGLLETEKRTTGLFGLDQLV